MQKEVTTQKQCAIKSVNINQSVNRTDMIKQYNAINYTIPTP